MRWLILILFIVGPTEAKTSSFKMKDFTVRYELPKGWIESKNLFGMPLVFLGPQEKAKNVVKKKRPVIGLINTGIKDNLPTAVMVKERADYEEGRKRWLKKRKGKLITFLPYRNEKLKKRNDLHFMGLEYELGGESFVEVSQFLFCGKGLIQVKGLFLKADFKRYEKLNSQFVRGLSCHETKTK